MNTKLAGLSAVVLGLVAAAAPAAAQLAATPVYFSPKQPTGLTVALDFGTTLSAKADGVSSTTKPNDLSGRVALGLPFITLGAGVGLYNTDVPGADKEIQFMGSGALKLFSPPLVPVGVSLQAGAGYLKIGSGVGSAKVISLPIGVGVAVKPTTPGMSVEAWGAPRIQFDAWSVAGSSRAQAGFGASGGVNLGMPMGLGLHIAADYSKLSAKASAGTGSLRLPERQTLVFGLGLHYTFTIPGLPIVPVI
ncbi:MAG: hypothetical protein HYW06_09330 [Gemmatimonadetes bacterium]|nr:hypothetical protein [Gemmatimonadota bacterium]MBI2537140.1 hypothetical protein [Gemmatimonadota bacterium]MBI2616317.1 hypothetical protein [Gemmatimonadota bacterium]